MAQRWDMDLREGALAGRGLRVSCVAPGCEGGGIDRTWRRLGALVLGAAYIWGTPFYRQVLDGRDPYARQWVMYGGYARETCVVDMRTPGPGGELVPFDRFAALGYDAPRHSPDWLRFATRANAGAAILARVCPKVGPDADLRMRVRCLEGDEGWIEVRSLDDNGCEGVAPRPQIPPPRIR